ncbi:MAG: cobalt-precorrin-5B (C(1))-methyltransferase CbiD [Eubacteriales bacterium]|nr:cobalt-precorrin-5B (C(1))-methyltransferase CbiD [Eubacteriales bacterium]
MAFERYIRSGQKRLRCGYTTGTCAALATAGAARLLLTGKTPETLSLMTPKGWEVTVAPVLCRMAEKGALCAVLKDGGDDADATSGLEIRVLVEKTDTPGIAIDGGEGVGRVTKPGLDQPVGSAAINRVPRQMITQQALAVCREAGYEGGLAVTVSIPGGAEAAKKTFNPHLGVVGGLSILGTSGIVEPMSEQALVASLEVELRQAAALGNRRLILTPGNYGLDYLRSRGWDRGPAPIVKYSNFLGPALDAAVAEGFEEVLLVGHLGKLVKVAGGVMNTHSRWADCRAELLCAHAALAGADRDLCRSLMEAPTTDACLELLARAGLQEEVMDSLLTAISRHLQRRVGEKCRIGAVLFSNTFGFLGQTPEATRLLRLWNYGTSDTNR